MSNAHSDCTKYKNQKHILFSKKKKMVHTSQFHWWALYLLHRYLNMVTVIEIWIIFYSYILTRFPGRWIPNYLLQVLLWQKHSSMRTRSNAPSRPCKLEFLSLVLHTVMTKHCRNDRRIPKMFESLLRISTKIQYKKSKAQMYFFFFKYSYSIFFLN